MSPAAPPAASTTEDRLLEAALRVFEEVGFHAATTRRIAEEAGVNEVTLFRRYKSKELLLLAAMHRHAGRERLPQLPDTPADPAVELRAWAREQLQFLAKRAPLMRVTMQELEKHPELCMPAHEGPLRVARHVRGYLDRLRELGLCGDHFDSERATWMLMGALFSEAMSRDMPGRPAAPLHEVADAYANLFLRAIGALPAPAFPPEASASPPRSS